MFNIACDKKNNIQTIIIQGDLAEVSSEIVSIIMQACKSGDVVSTSILRGIIDAKGKDFVENCLKIYETNKAKAIKAAKSKVEKEKNDLGKLLQELEKIVRGIADE